MSVLQVFRRKTGVSPRMGRMPDLHILRVFTAEDGSGGNVLGVFLDGAAVPRAKRQAVAAELGFSETVFVDDAVRGEVQIFTPAVELPFAGHPVPTRIENGQVLVAGRPEWAPLFRWFELGSPAEVEALTGAPEGHELAAA